MLTLIKTVGNYLFGSGNEAQESDVTDINSLISTLEEVTRDSIENDAVISEVKDHSTCERRIGTITSLNVNSGLIDGKFFFDLRDVPTENLEIDVRVEYLAFRRHENEEWRVRKIYSVIEDRWDVQCPNKIVKDSTEQYEVSQIISKDSMERSIVGKVSERKGRDVVITPGNIRFHLDEVSAEFIPLQGDWLILKALVEVNEEVCDLGGEVLEIVQISPLRSRIISGSITANSPEGSGVIDKSIFFFKDSCEPGFVPQLGDKVIAEAIESEQRHFSWRALTVVPIDSFEKNGARSSDTDEVSNSRRAFKELDALLQDKNGITITEKLDFGTLKLNERKELKAEIKNNGSYKQILLRAKFHSSRSQSQFILHSPQLQESLVIYPGKTVEFLFSSKGRFIGHSSELFVFTFKGFKIGRNLKVEIRELAQDSLSLIKNEGSHNGRFQKSIYDPRKRGIRIVGERPVKPPAFVPVKLGVFPVPDRFWDVILKSNEEKKHFEDTELDIQTVAPCLISDLNISNYSDRFHTLLYLEEIQIIFNMQSYNLKRVCFRLTGPGGEFLALEVPGLAEKRPSLLLGDKVVATSPFETQGFEYEGFIHKVFSSEIWIKFNSSFHSSYSGGEYNISFQTSRTPMRRYHSAINMALTHLGPQMLFPTKINLQPPQLHIKEQEYSHVSDQYNGLSPPQIDTATVDMYQNPCTPLTENNTINSSLSQNSSSSCISDFGRSPPRISVVERLFGMTSPTIGNCDNVLRNKENEEDFNESSIGATKVNFSGIDVPTNVSKNGVIPDFQKRKLKWFNSHLNKYQKNAVLNILNGEARPLPYVIFGPPGTGKTMTVVEAILQILILLPDSRLLVATPSNSSANLIAERLLDSGMVIPGDLVRLVGYHCIEEGTIPERLIPYSTTGDIRLQRAEKSLPAAFDEPLKLSSNAQTLGRHRITVGTCAALGQLYTMGFTRGHFTHVLVDEAGQATEPEIMVPLSFIHTSCGQIVLAGDPMQLGPVIMSPFASKMGLAESFLVRLLHRVPYQLDPHGFPDNGGYNPRVITKLAMNYRSVPELLTLPSSLFYHSYLQPQISQTVGLEAEILASLAEELPQRSIENGGPPPLVFHGVKGNNYQEEGSPSWYNPQEVVQALYYVGAFYNVGLAAVDIGIITPYQKQVQKLRAILEEFELDIPKIGSVEEFQGQERKVIILSTVRSAPSLLKIDIRHSLGFVASPKRLNVALTRARALLVILGNPHLLSRDPVWRLVLNFCVERGSYTGCDLPIDYDNLTNDVDEV